GPATNLIGVIVTDNGSPSLSATQTFTVAVLEVNTAPELAGIPDAVVAEGATLLVTNSATDVDFPANALAFTLGPGAPTNMLINATNGLITWLPTESQGPATNLIT